jgi:hypothetical protein
MKKKRKVGFKDMTLDQLFQLENQFSATIGSSSINDKLASKSGLAWAYKRRKTHKSTRGSAGKRSVKQIKKKNRR